MRRFSREGSQDEKQPYSLNKIIDETLDICLERINNSGTSVNIEHFVSDALIFCRPVEISQVLLNLINNSFHATYHLSHPWIKIKCIDHPDKYEIRLIDSGEGVPLSIRSKLFQPFFTTKDIGIGTGLGLSTSKGIIEEHMGHLVYVEDAVNTTFTITLPKLSREGK
jgi:C4-dicarboxylate-specific signal transduction histidine kinase